MKYLQISYYTLTGVKKIIELSDNFYGEWIIYDDKTPKYYVCVFDEGASNTLIKSLIDDKHESMGSILRKINLKQGTQLSFGNKPFIELIKKEELVELNLIQLPEYWIKNI